MEPLSCSLVLRNDRHQKSYNVQLQEHDGLWSVDFQYGAIGAPLRAGTKTPTTTTYEVARKIFDKLVDEKTGKKCDCCGGVYELEGVQGHPVGAAFIPDPTVPGFAPTFFPELLAPIGPDQAGEYVVNDGWELEEKLDGHRISILADGTLVYAFNRKGEIIPVPTRELAELAGQQVHLDGEFVKGSYVAFDILMMDGIEIQNLPRYQRRLALSRFIVRDTTPVGLHMVRTFTGTANKEAALQRFTEAHAEGVVFKKAGAPEGVKVCHSCDNPPCCRPDHLFRGSQRDNVVDAVTKGRLTNYRKGSEHHNARKTHCSKGHSFAEYGRVNSRGWRKCRKCERAK